jgi:hypothetical protein
MVLMLLVTVVVTFIPQMEKLVLRTAFSTFQAGLLNGKEKNIHPLRFARPTCLRGTIGWRSDILL